MQTVQEVQQLLQKHSDKTTYDVSELYSRHMTTHVQFSYAKLNEEAKGLTVLKPLRWYGCRGFMSEALFSAHINKKFSDMEWDVRWIVEGQPAVLLLQCITPEAMQSTMKLLNHLENIAGWEKSIFQQFTYRHDLQLPKKPHYNIAFLWAGDKRWFKAIPYLSLLLLLFRLNSKYSIEDQESSYEYFKRILDSLEKYKQINRGCLPQDFYTGDYDSLVRLTYHINTLDMLFDNFDFITQEVDYTKYTRHSSAIAHDRGIYSVLRAKAYLPPGNYDIKEVEMVARKRFEEGFCLNSTLALRLAIAFTEEGVTHA